MWTAGNRNFSSTDTYAATCKHVVGEFHNFCLWTCCMYTCIPLFCDCISETFKIGSRLSFVCISSKLLIPGVGLMEFPFFRFVNLLLSLISILKSVNTINWALRLDDTWIKRRLSNASYERLYIHVFVHDSTEIFWRDWVRERDTCQSSRIVDDQTCLCVR